LKLGKLKDRISSLMSKKFSSHDSSYYSSDHGHSEVTTENGYCEGSEITENVISDEDEEDDGNLTERTLRENYIPNKKFLSSPDKLLSRDDHELEVMSPSELFSS